MDSGRDDGASISGQHGGGGAVTGERLHRFQSLTSALMGCLTPADCADVVLREGIAAMGARAGSVVLLAPDGERLELVGLAGYPGEVAERWRSFPLDSPAPIAESVRTGEALFIGSREQRSARYPALSAGSPTSDHAWATIPFLLREGRAFGCLGIAYAEPQPFKKGDRAFLVTLGQQCALAMERARLYATVDAQRVFLRDVLASVTDGRLALCEKDADLPPHLPLVAEVPALSRLEHQPIRALRRVVREAADACGIAGERADDLVTAANEAAANAISHGGGGTARVCADAGAGRVQVWIADRGKGIDLHRLPKATLQKGYTTAGTLGHGFKMILALVDQVHLLTGPTGTTVAIEQGRRPPSPW